MILSGPEWRQEISFFPWRCANTSKNCVLSNVSSLLYNRPVVSSSLIQMFLYICFQHLRAAQRSRASMNRPLSDRMTQICSCIGMQALVAMLSELAKVLLVHLMRLRCGVKHFAPLTSSAKCRGLCCRGIEIALLRQNISTAGDRYCFTARWK